MSAVINNGDVIRALYVSSLSGQVALNRFYFRTYGKVGLPTDVQVAATFDANSSAFWKAVMSSAALYHGVSAQILRPSGGPPPTFFQRFVSVPIVGAAGNGTRGATPLPGQVRGIWRWQGALAARGLNCRCYSPWPSSTDLQADGMTPTGLYQVALGAVASSIETTTVSNDGAGNIINLQLIDFQDFAPAVPAREDLSSHVVHPKWATQRRSGAYGKANSAPF